MVSNSGSEPTIGNTSQNNDGNERLMMMRSKHEREKRITHETEIVGRLSATELLAMNHN
jgi:hypothetical protein